MTNTNLLVRLRDLHEELSVINEDLMSVDKVDEGTVDALGQLVTDVGLLVDRANLIVISVDSGGSELEHADLLDRVRQFENEHPRVTRFLSQVTDLIAMIGI
ncbi:MAG: DUF4404 family protein [Pirellulaceae bacterium]|nr:DUF4404 family protein [Pirellulaceae bacterium]